MSGKELPHAEHLLNPQTDRPFCGQAFAYVIKGKVRPKRVLDGYWPGCRTCVEAFRVSRRGAGASRRLKPPCWWHVPRDLPPMLRWEDDAARARRRERQLVCPTCGRRWWAEEMGTPA